MPTLAKQSTPISLFWWIFLGRMVRPLQNDWPGGKSWPTIMKARPLWPNWMLMKTPKPRPNLAFVLYRLFSKWSIVDKQIAFVPKSVLAKLGGAGSVIDLNILMKAMSRTWLFYFRRLIFKPFNHFQHGRTNQCPIGTLGPVFELFSFYLCADIHGKLWVYLH